MSPRRAAVLLLAFSLPLLASDAAGATTAATTAVTPNVDIVKVEGALDRPLIAFVNDALDAAEEAHATVVLELDSAGSFGDAGVALADRIASMPIPVLVWIGPVPAKASGAGLLLLYASSLAAVAPGSQTGPLDPVDLLHPGSSPPGLNAMIDGWLAARGRSVDRAEENDALTAQQAIDGGFASVHATSVLELLNIVDGTTVPTSAGPTVLHTKIAETDAEAQSGGVTIRFHELGPVKRVAHGVASPSMIYILLVFGLACLSFEQTQPGFGFAGFAGVFLLALAVWGMTFAPPSWLGLGVLLAGVGAMVLDVRMRRFGVATWAGIALFLAGSVLLYLGGGAGDPDLALADRRDHGRDVPLLRLRPHGGDAIPRSHRVHAAGPDRPDRGGAWAAGAGRTRLREGGALARPDPRPPDRSGDEGPRARRRRHGAAGRGRRRSS